MAKISEVNYKEFPSKITQMRTLATSVNTEINSAYTHINTMKENWYGARYNTLATKCNAISPDIDKLLTLILTQIPYALEQVANNYSTADRGAKIVSEKQTAHTKVITIEQSTDESMRFLTAQVTATQLNVRSSFNNALSDLEKYKKMFDSLNWHSQAADAFRSEFNRLKNSVTASLNNVEELFSQLMKQAIDDIGSAESHNTVIEPTDEETDEIQ